MKKNQPPSKHPANDSSVEQALGGQPENDADARAAGLESATSAGAPAGKSGRKERVPAPPVKKSGRD